MADISSGFAIRRNGSCLAVEVDCGKTVDPYHACCPSSTVCPTQYNIDCCPPGKNCTASLVATPRCANSSWTMYNNGGFFCCESGTLGYAALNSGSDGCLLPIGAPPSDIQLLAVASQTVSSGTSTIASSTTTSPSSLITSSSSTRIGSSVTSAASPTSSNPLSTGKQGNNSLGNGAIAGIVVGVIVGIAILMLLTRLFHLRRKKMPLLTFAGQNGKSGAVYMHELGGLDRQEMPASASKSILKRKDDEYSELPVTGPRGILKQKREGYSELPAEGVNHTIQR